MTEEGYREPGRMDGRREKGRAKGKRMQGEKRLREEWLEEWERGRGKCLGGEEERK